MKLQDLGLRTELEQSFRQQDIDPQSIGRVISEHKERYVVAAEGGEYEAEVMGKLRFLASSRASFPAVGDWVSIAVHDDTKASILSILPRTSVLERQAVGAYAEKQVIAANIDYGLIVQALDRDFSVNRIERYMTICSTADIAPVIVLSKADLIDQASLQAHIDEVRARVHDTPFIPISSESQFGYAKLEATLQPGKTYCLLGSSGVGKSTIINNLVGTARMDTGDIGLHSNRGKHVTTHRELVVLQSGGILIDNPGMREVGIGDAAQGLDVTFSDITVLANQCRFNDCKHIKEKGCAILAALQAGEIDTNSYKNFMRLQRETEHYQASVAEKRNKGRDLAKQIKLAKKNKRVR